MAVLAACVAAHVLMVDLSPSAWWVPDLTLVGLVLAVGRRPHRWLLYSTVTGLVTTVWAVRFPALVFVSHLGIGAGLQMLARRWDTNDVRVASLLVGLLSLAQAFGAMWLEDLWSVPLLGLVSVHVCLTTAALLWLRRLLQPLADQTS